MENCILYFAVSQKFKNLILLPVTLSNVPTVLSTEMLRNDSVMLLSHRDMEHRREEFLGIPSFGCL